MNLSRIEKKLNNIRINPKNVSFQELKSVLEYLGFTVKNYSGGSHYAVSHPSIKRSIKPIPYHKPLKKYCVIEVLELIDELEGLI